MRKNVPVALPRAQKPRRIRKKNEDTEKGSIRESSRTRHSFREKDKLIVVDTVHYPVCLDHFLFFFSFLVSSQGLSDWFMDQMLELVRLHWTGCVRDATRQVKCCLRRNTASVTPWLFPRLAELELQVNTILKILLVTICNDLIFQQSGSHRKQG